MPFFVFFSKSLPRMLRDYPYRHRRRCQGEESRTGSMPAAGRPRPRGWSWLFFTSAREVPIPALPTSSELGRSLGSVVYIFSSTRDSDAGHLDGGNMRELDQPRSAQTCVVSIRAHSVTVPSFVIFSFAWVDIDMNARTRKERRLERERELERDRYVIISRFRPRQCHLGRAGGELAPVHPGNTRRRFCRSKLAGSVSGPWASGHRCFSLSSLLFHLLHRLSKSGRYLIMVRFL